LAVVRISGENAVVGAGKIPAKKNRVRMLHLTHLVGAAPDFGFSGCRIATLLGGFSEANLRVGILPDFSVFSRFREFCRKFRDF
jgi:hypothetical protein